MSGILIALEGIDGTGTTSMAEALAGWLVDEDFPVLLTAEPSEGAAGRLIREALAGRGSVDEATLALLFAADRLDHLAVTVEPALAKGTVVVSDRYVLSSLAYQSVANDAAWVEEINRKARPADLTILLDAPVEVCLDRVAGRGQRRERYEEAAFLEKVRQNYLDLAAAWSEAERLITVVDASMPIDQVQEAVIQVVPKAL